MYALSGRTADDVWRAAAALFKDGGPARSQDGRGGGTMEVLHVGMAIQEPRERWVGSRTPAMNPAFALVEVFWIVSGRRDAALPLYWNPALARFSGNASEYHGAYGYRLREHFGLDQLDRVFRVLENRPDSRQAVLQIWDSTIDLPDEEGAPANLDIPCNVLAVPKVREGKLEWMQILRSNDLFLGVPHNVVQFTSLQEMLAGWLGIMPGTYEHFSDSLHVYTRDLNAVGESLVPVALPPNTDSFALDRRSWDQAVSIVITRLERMMRPSLNAHELRSLALAGDAPSAYEHAVRVAAADAARRRGWQDIVEDCVAGIANPALVALWSRWQERIQSRSAAAIGTS
jgi:thymidylate synthase